MKENSRNRLIRYSLAAAFLGAAHNAQAAEYYPQHNAQAAEKIISYSDFLKHAQNHYYSDVLIEGSRAKGAVSLGNPHRKNVETNGADVVNPDFEFTQIPPGESLASRLEGQVRITAAPPPRNWMPALISWIPWIALAWISVFGFRQKNSGKTPGFGKSKARRMSKYSGPRIKFEDVAGIDEAREELQEIVEFLKNPSKFQSMGAQIPKGVLLTGQPGVGKTLLAKAVAGEAGVPFYTISGSDFVEMFVGVGASRVRDMFEQAKKDAPCIIFIDEIDAVGRARGAGQGGNNDEREQTLNQLLVEMDGFEKNEKVILIAATNRPDILDKALLRPGRFDRQVEVPSPDVIGRAKILGVHARKIKMDKDVNITAIARATPGFSGAELANIVNEAALLAAREDKQEATMDHFWQARDKVTLGAERKSTSISDHDRRVIAYHQAGHALVIMNTPDATPLEKVTIVQRGQDLGKAFQLPKGDQISINRGQIDAALTVAMGGRVAEELAFGKKSVTSMAADDVKKARDLAYRAVTEWGMSDTIGPVLSTKGSGAQMTRVDMEVKKIVTVAFNEASRILAENRHDLDVLADALLTHETLNIGQIMAILNITHEIDDLRKAPAPV